MDLTGFFSKDKPTKFIVEGSIHDYGDMMLDVGESFIQNGVYRFDVKGFYTLELVSYLLEGRMKNINILHSNKHSLDFDINKKVYRPRGLLTEDGYFYYDKSLLEQNPDFDLPFKNFLEYQLRRQKSFYDTYQEIKDNKHERLEYFVETSFE